MECGGAMTDRTEKVPPSIRRFIRATARQCICRLVGPLLRMRERRLLAGPPAPDLAPLFIVAPPRSGTTVVYQLLVHSLGVSYFPNIANLFPRAPIAATRTIRKRVLSRPACYRSYAGITPGLVGASQGNRIWERWFGHEQAPAPSGSLSEQTLLEMRATIAGISRTLGGGFVSKTIAHSVRIPALVDAFPNAVFLWVRRDPSLTIQSHYLSMLDLPLRDGSLREWLSAKPREYEVLKDLPRLERICNQIHFLHRNIGEDLAQFARGRHMTIAYEDACDNPAETVEAVRTFWQARCDQPIESRDVSFPQLHPFTGDRLEPEQCQLIADTVGRLEIDSPIA
jgi:hypothetical protein